MFTDTILLFLSKAHDLLTSAGSSPDKIEMGEIAYASYLQAMPDDMPKDVFIGANVSDNKALKSEVIRVFNTKTKASLQLDLTDNGFVN